jgi:TolB-like protein
VCDRDQPEKKSIAVLLFENFSPAKDNTFSANGIQMNPNKSRKHQRSQSYQSFSVMEFRDAAVKNMREIGRNLGVANILEGSVRKECAKTPLLSLANSKTGTNSDTARIISPNRQTPEPIFHHGVLDV